MEKQLPKNWIEVQLIDILEVLENGSRPKGGVQGIFDGVPSLGGEHLDSNGGFKFGKLKYVPTSFAEKMNRGKIKKNDILIVKDGATTGKTSFIDNNFPFDLAFVNEHVFICRTFPNLNSKCIFYFLFGKLGFNRIMDNFTGSAQGGINQKFASNTLIPLPPLAEQNRIVAKLDTLFVQLETIKASMDKIPVLLKEFRQQVLTQAVTGKLTEEWRKGKELEEWEKTRFEEIVISSNNGISKRSGKYGTETIVLRLADFKDALRVYGNERKIALTDNEKEKYLLIENDLLVIRVNGSVSLAGLFVLYKNKNIEETYCDHFIRFRINNELAMSEYITYVTNNGLGRNYLFNSLSTSAGQNTINQKSINNLEFALPTLKEQQEIVSRVESLFAKADTIEHQYQSLKEKIDTLPQALLHKAFKGELTKQLESDGDARELLQQIQELKGATGKKVKSKTTKKT